jgi:polysaccharide deacetylase family protein (PEP-CTERM system associated)
MTAQASQPIRHHFTVDVEEYFQVSALEPFVARARWEVLPSRVELGVRCILDLLAEHDARATFFVLSWVADRQRALIREIAKHGHEIASHGTDHRRVTELTPEQFRESVRTSKRVLEDITRQPVIGYRAPSFSITRDREWALDILAEEGYRYDSSLFPVKRQGYGFEGGQRDPHTLRRPGGSLKEIPPATVEWGGRVLPAGGGAYFRILPYSLVRSALRAAERRGVPGTFYIHPWEVDPEQPRFAVPLTTRVRHYGGLGGTTRRLRRLLSTFRFGSIAETISAGVSAMRDGRWPEEAGLRGAGSRQ